MLQPRVASLAQSSICTGVLIFFNSSRDPPALSMAECDHVTLWHNESVSRAEVWPAVYRCRYSAEIFCPTGTIPPNMVRRRLTEFGGNVIMQMQLVSICILE